MDDLDLPDLLGGGNSTAGPDVLAGIVRRHGRLRARRARLAATTVMVVSLAGAGIGLELSGLHNHVTTAALGPAPTGGRDRAPAGLMWASATHAAATSAGPGVFGWLGVSYGSSASAVPSAPDDLGAVTASPQAALVAPGELGGHLPSVCTTRGCGPLYSGESMKRLFRRSAGGVTIEAEIADFDLATGPRLPVSFPETGQLGHTVAGSRAHASRPTTSPATRVVLPCVSQSELLVTVSRGASTATLAVPGAVSGPSFSVVASASTVLAGSPVVLAVTYTSPSVRTVTSEFPGGGEDHMTPVDGWSVLAQAAHHGLSLSAAGAVTLVATSATGATLSTVRLPATGALARTTPTSQTCHYWIASRTTISSPPPASAGSPPTSGKSG